MKGVQKTQRANPDKRLNQTRQHAQNLAAS